MIRVDQLHPAPWNSNRMTTATRAKIQASIQTFGVVENLVARPNPAGEGWEVLSGNHRLQVLRELGHKTAPVIIVDVDDARARVLAHTLNRTRGTDDPDAYAAMMREALEVLTVEDVATYVPESEDDLARYITATTMDPQPETHSGKGTPPPTTDATPRVEGTTEPTGNPPAAEWGRVAESEGDEAAEYVPDVPDAPTTKPGDIITLGPHRLMCGDSTNPDHVAALMDGQRAAAVFTDPPYAIYGSASGIGSDIADDSMIRPFFRDVLAATMRSTDRWAHIYVCCDWRSWASWWEAAKLIPGLEPKNLLVWDKGGAGLGGMYALTYELIGFFAHGAHATSLKGTTAKGHRNVYAPNVLRYNRTSPSEREHNAAKPLALIRRILELSNPEGGLVLDLFGGSGSTLIAADQLGHPCAMMEKDPRWCDVIRDRYRRHLEAQAD